jgi:hypothetical protein
MEMSGRRGGRRRGPFREPRPRVNEKGITVNKRTRSDWDWVSKFLPAMIEGLVRGFVVLVERWPWH